MTDPLERWPLADRHDVRDELAAAYADDGRGYHDTLHLTEVLDRLDELAGAGTAFDATVARLAAWFHDAVYDGERDAEERSAVWAEQALEGTAYAAEVARLVRLTETHDPAPTTPPARRCATPTWRSWPPRATATTPTSPACAASTPTSATPTSPAAEPPCCRASPDASSCSTRPTGGGTGSPSPGGTSSGSSRLTTAGSPPAGASSRGRAAAGSPSPGWPRVTAAFVEASLSCAGAARHHAQAVSQVSPHSARSSPPSQAEVPTSGCQTLIEPVDEPVD